MIRHIVAWNFRAELTPDQREEHGRIIKTAMESLGPIIPGLVRLDIHFGTLSGCTRDIILDSLFENEAALDAYQEHPEHKKAGALLGAVAEGRICLDFPEPAR